jgi:uncharacterized protein (DUF2062 family)
MRSRRTVRALAGGLAAGTAFGGGVAGAHLLQGDTSAYYVDGNSECASGRSAIAESSATVAQVYADTFSTGTAFCAFPNWKGTGQIFAAADLYTSSDASLCVAGTGFLNPSTAWALSAFDTLAARCGARNYKTRGNHGVVINGAFRWGNTISPDHYFG